MADWLVQLCQILAQRLRDDPQADLAQLVDYLKASIEGNPQLAAAIQADSCITQINQGNATAFQTLVKGGIANIGTHIHADAETLTAVLEAFFRERQARPTGIPQNIPYTSVSEFVGRARELENLHQQLQRLDCVAISAIVGMGGVGKTELAIQYALKHRETYQAGICWLQARGQDVGIQVVNFARTHLSLNPPDNLDLANQVSWCWQHWPEGDVLIVWDDVQDYANLKPYLPPPSSRFKVLITTRKQLLKTSQRLELDVLKPRAAIALLKSLVSKERLQEEPWVARSLCKWLDYLPLGLELVGRYLARKPELSLLQMQQRLQTKRLDERSLSKPKSEDDMTAQRGVLAAFELSWQELNDSDQRLGRLLSLFALAPIPWRLVEHCLPEQEPEELEEIRDDILLNLHLLQRKGEGTYQLHQLIREFFQQKFKELAQADELKRAFAAAMVAVVKQISYSPTRQEIVKVTPAIPHVAEVAKNLNEYLSDEDLYLPFIGLGRFYQGQGFYNRAEPWYEQSLIVTQNRFGLEHPSVVASLNNLALIYHLQRHYQKAEPLYVQALELQQRLLGQEHPSFITGLINLALLYSHQDHYQEAEPLRTKALELMQRLPENDHVYKAPALNNLAPALNNLALLYHRQGLYQEAEPLYVQALELRRHLLGHEHPDVAQTLHNLAGLYECQGLYQKAEPLYVQALELRQRLLNPEHPDVGQSLNHLAGFYISQGRYEEAEELYQQALALYTRLLGAEHPIVAGILNNLAALYHYYQGRYQEAKTLYMRALEIYERRLGDNHPVTVRILENLERCSSLNSKENNED
jgi:tetratricopeptide (TPR) repeat protein